MVHDLISVFMSYFIKSLLKANNANMPILILGVSSLITHFFGS